ncbi:MAG: hypothetical protein IJP83_00010, partial [Mycoplasma sp.]|nr:hypothetical protein [Mycoplasma sp.]
ANYKETKIQTALITLDISSEQSENTGNLNYAIKDALYDENTISQELLDFVKYVNFSLDYTENDYNTDKDGKKGEILVNNIIIGYKNSKNTFTVSNSDTKKAISSAINNDSGITTKWSKNLWSNIRDRYNDVVSVVGLKKLKEITLSEIESVDDAEFQYMAIHIASGVLILAMIIWFIFQVCRNHPFKDNKCKTALIVIICIICYAALGWGIYNTLTKMGSSWENLNDKLKDIEPTTTSYQIIKNIDDDEKYFIPKDAKAKFDELSIDEMRKKKVYYESGYKLTKGETESDLTKYLGGKKAHENLIANIEDIIESFTLMFIITAGIVLMAFLLAYIILKLNEAVDPGAQAQVANQVNVIGNASQIGGAQVGAINDSIGAEANAEVNQVINKIQPTGNNQNPNPEPPKPEPVDPE